MEQRAMSIYFARFPIAALPATRASTNTKSIKIMDKIEKTNLGYYSGIDHEYEACPVCENNTRHKNDSFCCDCIGDLIYKTENYIVNIESKDSVKLYLIDNDFTILDCNNYYDFKEYILFEYPTLSDLHELHTIYTLIQKVF